MKISRRGILRGIFVSTFVLSSSHASTSYDPRTISDMPAEAEDFVQHLNTSSSQVRNYSSTPGMRRGINNLNNYYNLQYENFMKVFQKDLNTMGAVSDIVSEADSAPAISACLDSSNRRSSWGDFKDALESLGDLGKYVNKSVASGQAAASFGGGFGGFSLASLRNDRGVSSDINHSYSLVAKYVDMKKRNSGMLKDLHDCCAAAGAKAVGVNVCSESYVKDHLADLANLEDLPTDFVDPLRPGPFVQNLTSDDIITMISLGQMNDFINATDFNTQAAALMAADQKCQDARESALNKLGHTAQLKGLAQTAINTLHCSMWSFMQNSSKGMRTFALGLTKASFPLFNMVSQCPQEIQDAATLSLTYTPDQFRADFQTLGSLPGNIAYSSPVAKPIAIGYLGDGSMTLELRDEPGFVQSSMIISANPATTTSSVLPTSVLPVATTVNSTGGTVVASSSGTSSGRVTGSSVMRALVGDPPRGGSVVRGVGETISKSERLAVRSLANKASEGDLESARTLASSVKSRVAAVKTAVAGERADRTLVSRSAARATAARELVTTGTSVDVARGTSKVFEEAFRGILSRSLDDTSGGRVVERPTGTSTSTGTTTTGSSVTTNSSYTDSLAQRAYQDEQDKKNHQALLATISTVGTTLDGVADRLNDVISKKRDAIDKYRVEFDPGKIYSDLSNLGADARANKLIQLSKEWGQTVKQITSLNAQELGMHIALETGESHLQNLIAGAQAFDNLNVIVGNVRGPASVLPTSNQQNGLLVNGSINPLQLPTLNSNTSSFFNNANGPITVMPPVFKPSPSLTMIEVNRSPFFRMLDFLTLPSAQAALTPMQRRQKFHSEWEKFLGEFKKYQDKLDTDAVALKKQMWERYIINERENRKAGYLSTEVRAVVGSFNQAVHEELPDLLAARNNRGLPAGANPQIKNYIEEIRRASAELNEVVADEAKLSLQNRATDPNLDEDSWTGLLPAMALQ